jgi:hypothetical protein
MPVTPGIIASMSRPSLLVVTAAPDDRPSTTTLRDVVAELRRRRDLDVHLWYLRDGGRDTGDADRVVDSLREEEPAATLDRFGMGRAAGVARGRRLRRWFRDDPPTWILLDDGLGDRLLDAVREQPRRILRVNPDPPADASIEPPAARAGDLLIVTDGADPAGRTAPSRLDLPLLRDHVRGRAARAAAARERVRDGLGVPSDVPLVVGWGEDQWLDGPDLLVRSLWALEAHHGVVAHGLWLGIDPDGDDGVRVLDEARRCGVAARFTLAAEETAERRLCGDAVLLPYRSPGDPEPVHEALVAGCGVVTFPVWSTDDPGVRLVGHLDVDAAADALVEVLADDRGALAERAEQRYDVGPWVDRFVSALRDVG